MAEVVRELLSRRGAVFFADVARAVGGFPNDVLETLWKMVWAGEVTNDTLEPLRSRAQAAASETRRPHPRHPRAPRTGPAGSEGRWSLRASRWPAPVLDTDRRAALAGAMLDRYGVVTRECAHAEGVAGGFSAVYDVLKALEDRGRVRRGYFVEGRGGAQFALPGADDRLRSHRAADVDAAPLVLAATDPANAYGALLEWPASQTDSRPQRAAGALVVLRDGELLGWLGRGDHPLLTFLPEEEPARSDDARALARALAERVDSGGLRALLIATIDGAEAERSPLAPCFLGAGFSATAQGLMRRGRHARGAETTAAET
jgi:ATP-dependent Lhr-like helicase